MAAVVVGAVAVAVGAAAAAAVGFAADDYSVGESPA